MSAKFQLFGKADNLVSISLPSTIKTIGSFSLLDYAKADIDFNGAKPTNIKAEAVAKVKSISNIDLSEAVSIETDAFLKSTFEDGFVLNMPNLSGIARGAFSHSNITRLDNLGLITSLPDGEQVNGEWRGVFSFCTSLTSVTLPEGILTIGTKAFRESVNCRIENLPSSITRLGDMCFYKTSFDLDVVVPNLTTMEFGVFSESKVRRVLDMGSITTLPNVTSQGFNKYNYVGVFTLCTELEVAILPETMTNISAHAFSGCKKLNYLILKSDTPPTLSSVSGIGLDTPIYMRGGGYIYVPDASVETYKSATNWVNFSDVIKGISELITDNPTLYAEISPYLQGVIMNSGLVVAPSSKSVNESTIQLYSYYNGERVTATYSINSSVASIDVNGLVTFSAEGTAEVTISYNGNTITRTYTYKTVAILHGFEIDKTGANVVNANRSIVGFVPCTPSTNIKWGVTGGTLGNLVEFNDSKSVVGYWTPNANPRTIAASSETRYVKASFQTSRLDYAYIYDATNQIYLWKGSKVS